MEVLCCVLVFRGVATADVAAGETEPKVNPIIADFQALFTAPRMRFHVMNLIRVLALHDVIV
jgi:hypothetical protein